MSLMTPIRYSVKHYSSTDQGAPTFVSTAGSLKNLLKACLISGYGSKEGAGWVLDFDDTNKMIVSFPNNVSEDKPSLRIDNGDGAYKISSIYNPSGFSDTNYIYSTGLPSIDSTLKPGWDLIVSDVGFILSYGIGENGFGGPSSKNNMILFCGYAKKIIDSADEGLMITNYSASTSAGTLAPWRYGITYTSAVFYNMLNGSSLGVAGRLVTGNLGTIEFYHELIISKYIFPMMVSTSSSIDTDRKILDTGDRVFLKIADYMYQNYGRANYYLPLDYWEI